MFAVFGQYLRLPRTVKIVALGRILNSMGSFVVILSTPLLTQHLGLSAAAAGAWLFAAQLAFLTGTLAAGWVLDHLSKTWLLAATLLANAVAFSIGTFTVRVVVVGVGLIVGYFFHGAWRPSMIAVAADETHEDDHAVAFSLMYFVHNIGYLVAPVAAGWLFAWNPRSVFAADAVSSVVAAAVVLLGTGTALTAFRPAPHALDHAEDHADDHAEDRDANRQNGRTRGEEDDPSAEVAGSEIEQVVTDDDSPTDARITSGAAPERPTADGGFLRTAVRDRPLVLFTAAFVLGQFTYSQVAFALPLTIIDRLGPSGTAIYGIVMAVNAAIVIALAPLLTALTKAWRPVTAIGLATLFYLVGFGMLFFVGSIPMFLVSALIWTTGEVLSAIHINVFITRRAPRALRGRYLSSLRVIFAVGKILAPAVGGLIVQTWNVRAVWLVTSVLYVVAATAFLRVRGMIVAEERSAEKG